MMASQSPSQMAGFTAGTNFYGQGICDFNLYRLLQKKLCDYYMVYYFIINKKTADLIIFFDTLPGTLPLPQRAIGGNHFRSGNSAGHITPTSMNPGFSMGLQQQQQPQQQQHSPNSLAAIGPRSVLGAQSQANQASLASLQKRAFK